MRFQQDIQCLPLSLRLGFTPLTLICVYLIQLQTRVFTIFSNEAHQNWAMTWLYLAVALVTLILVAWDQIQIPLKFMYSCFFKRIGDHGNDQQSRLESFYQDQAKSKLFFLAFVTSLNSKFFSFFASFFHLLPTHCIVYDGSRGPLLRGRKTMLKLCAAQLKEQMTTGLMSNIKPIWIDLGGGTGWNIETMNESFPIDRFEKVILVDLTPSLCQVARERFESKGWKNVVVLCQDASSFQLPGLEGALEGRVALVTVSYACK